MKRVYTIYKETTQKQGSVSEAQVNDIGLQKAACRKFVECKSDWKIEKEFEESGVPYSGDSGSARDVIQDLQKAAQNNEFDILLVYAADCLDRFGEDAVFMIEWFIRTAGVEVCCVTEGELYPELDGDRLKQYLQFWSA